VEAIANARYTGGPDGAVLVTLRDVTEHRHLEALLTHRATHDPLTGLANRDELVKGLNLATATRVTAPSALVFLDLDGFKEINDGFGHDVGDDVLRAVARRLEGSVRPRDIAARLGGVEFGVLLRDVEDADAARVRVERLRAVFRRPVSVQRQSLAVHASLGVVMIDEHQADTDVRDLLRDADIAMYASKLGRRQSAVFYTPALATHRADRALGDAAQPGGG
jgi:diguanylate cyclase (GGDEF)-like protein